MNQRQLTQKRAPETELYGFSLAETHFIEELQCHMRLFRHESGAELIYLNTPSRDKCFGLSFKLSPCDDTGVAHIIEHAILCGSQKYKVKNWGGGGLLSSFYGAFTMRDASMYPVASENEASFQELVRLYTDAVFAPLALQSDLPMKQEGWHYEYDKEKDALSYRGIVYSEMQASCEMPAFILADLQIRAAFADTSLACNIGGDPAAIPDLTYDHFLDSYRQIFTAENCLAIVCGKTRLEEVLQTLSPYLRSSGRPPLQILGEPSRGDAVSAPLRDQYPLPQGADRGGKDYIGFNWVLPGGRENALLSEILCTVLQSRFSTKLPDYDLTLSAMTDTYRPFISLVVRSVNREDFPAIRQAVEEAVKDCLAEGFSDEKAADAMTALSYQYSRGMGFVPDSVAMGIKATTAWVHGMKPWENLEYAAFFRKLQEGHCGKTLEQFAARAFSENPYHTSFILEAEPGLSQKRQAAEAAVLARRREAMTEEELAAVIAEAEALHAYQSAPDDPQAVSALPVAKISDLPQDAPVLYPEIIEKDGRKLLFFETDSTIVKGTLHYLLPRLTEEETCLLGILSLLFGKLPADGLSSDEVRRQINRYTGGVKLFAEADALSQDTAGLRLQIQFDTLEKDFPEAQKLIGRLIRGFGGDTRGWLHSCAADPAGAAAGSSLQNAAAVRNLLSQYAAATGSANPDISLRASSCCSAAAAAEDLFRGVGFNRYIQQLLTNFDDRYPEVTRKLAALAKTVFDCSRLTAGLCCRRKSLDHLGDSLHFPSAVHVPLPQSYPLTEPKELFVSAGNMQFIAQSACLDCCSGPLLAAASLASDFASAQIRDIGGAYKVYVTLTQQGELTLETGRDPNLAKTLEAFRQLPDQLASADDTQIRSAVISAAAAFTKTFRLDQSALMPAGESSYDQAARNYFSGNTAENQQALWESLLTATPRQVRDCSRLFKEAVEKQLYCAVASPEKADKEGELFTQIYR